MSGGEKKLKWRNICNLQASGYGFWCGSKSKTIRFQHQMQLLHNSSNAREQRNNVKLHEKNNNKMIFSGDYGFV